MSKPPEPETLSIPDQTPGRQLGTGQSPQPNRSAPGFSGGGGVTTSAYRPPTRRFDGPSTTGRWTFNHGRWTFNHGALDLQPGVLDLQPRGAGPSALGHGNGNGNMAAGVKRPPLSDLSNIQPQHKCHRARTEEGADVKRQRVVGPGFGPGNFDGAASDAENISRDVTGAGWWWCWLSACFVINLKGSMLSEMEYGQGNIAMMTSFYCLARAFASLPRWVGTYGWEL